MPSDTSCSSWQGVRNLKLPASDWRGVDVVKPRGVGPWFNVLHQQLTRYLRVVLKMTWSWFNHDVSQWRWILVAYHPQNLCTRNWMSSLEESNTRHHQSYPPTTEIGWVEVRSKMERMQNYKKLINHVFHLNILQHTWILLYSQTAWTQWCALIP